MERALVFFVIYFSAFLLVLCCIILTLISFNIYFPLFENILDLRALVLWYFVLYFFLCETRSGIVEFCVIFFRVWNVL